MGTILHAWFSVWILLLEHALPTNGRLIKLLLKLGHDRLCNKIFYTGLIIYPFFDPDAGLALKVK